MAFWLMLTPRQRRHSGCRPHRPRHWRRSRPRSSCRPRPAAAGSATRHRREKQSASIQPTVWHKRQRSPGLSARPAAAEVGRDPDPGSLELAVIEEAQTGGQERDDRRRLMLRPEKFGRGARLVMVFEKARELVLVIEAGK